MTEAAITTLSLDEPISDHTADPLIHITCSDSTVLITYKSTLMHAQYFHSLYSAQWSDNSKYDLFIDRSSTIVQLLLQLLRYDTVDAVEFESLQVPVLQMLVSDSKYYGLNDTLVSQLSERTSAEIRSRQPAAHTHIDTSLVCGLCYSDCRAGNYLYWCRDHVCCGCVYALTTLYL